jgi:hypothetical protein
MHSGGPYAFKDKPYKTAEVYQYNDGEDLGVEFIFEQCGSGHPPIWRINPDILLALGLIQEGDAWVRPEEGYIDVIRQRRNSSGKIVLFEIRNEFLRDRFTNARRPGKHQIGRRTAFYRGERN